MKKLMTSAMILLPLLVLAIMLVSGAIYSQFSHIYVDSIEFVENDALVLVLEDETAPPAKQVEVNILPLQAPNRSLKFSVDDETIASVDENGVVTARDFGETYLTVKSAENTAVSASRKVIVTDDTVHKIRPLDYPTDLYKGDSQQLRAEVLPFAASDKSLIWSSSDDDILSVTQNGGVVCKGAGTVTITATSVSEPSVSATFEIACHLPLTGISVDVHSVMTAALTEPFPEIAFFPAKDDVYKVTYASSDDTIATVDADGLVTFSGPGKAVITATATDGKDHSFSAAVTYRCTDGYYEGSLFEKTSYTFAYETFAGQRLDGIRLQKNPAGSRRKIVEAVIDKPDVIAFDPETETFSLKEVEDDVTLGLVTIKLRAGKYDRDTDVIREFATDICEVTITRGTTGMSFSIDDRDEESGNLTTIRKASIKLGEIVAGKNPGGQIGLVVTPQNHTDAVAFSVSSDGDIAQLRDGNLLYFEQEGIATVTATAGDVIAVLHVSYVAPSDSSKDIDVSADSAETQYLTLQIHSNGTKETGLLILQGTVTDCVSDKEEILSVDGQRLTPLKGGFATVTITFDGDGGPIVRKILVYADREVGATQILFDIEEGRTTAKDSIPYTVTLDVDADAMEGKQLFLDGAAAEPTEAGAFVYAGTKTFGDKTQVGISADIRYAPETEAYGANGVICSADRTVHTTRGALTSAPEVTAPGIELKPTTDAAGEDNVLTFSDLGETIDLTIDATEAKPADATLTREAIAIDAHSLFAWSIESIDDKTATVRLTATAGGTDTATLTVAGQTFRLRLEIAAPVDTITLRVGDRALEADHAYTTLLTSLEVTVILGRADKNPVTDKAVHYSFGDETEHAETAIADSVLLTLAPSGTKTLTVRSGKASIRITIEKKALSGLALSYYVSYSDNGETRTLEPFTLESAITLAYSFPKSLPGSFDLCIELPDMPDNLGGFDEAETTAFFRVTPPDRWTYKINAALATITVTIPADTTVFVDRTLLFGTTATDATATLILTRVDVVRIELQGFDGNDKTNGGDVYKGYQQVRVFAKQSYYDGAQKDYFRIPLKALKNEATGELADPSLLTWTLTRYVGETATGVVASQRGYKVVCDGAEYELKQEGDGYVLQAADGTVVVRDGNYVGAAPHVTFVDPYSEPGYARIYFGAFAGLTETDVRNDYFGNFGEKSDWEQTPEAADDGSGRAFDASENAWSYLRVEAGDGAKDSKANAHFNFNVLDAADVVNVFDAAGYYANANIVLHEDLYGPGELGSAGAPFENATRKGLFLNRENASGLGKTLVYGNGCQVNLEAYNEVIRKDVEENPIVSGGNRKYPNGYNESIGVTFTRAYNTVIKCANPNSTLDGKTQTLVLKMQYAYYCDLSYYYKFNPSNKTFYAKNTVFSNIPKTAIQLYYNGDVLYAENIVMTECGTSIQADNQSEQNIKIYYKGTIDVLNYFNQPALTNLNQTVGGFFDEVVPGVKDYFEWHGQNVSANTNSFSGVEKIYVNILAFAASDLSNKAFVWNGAKYDNVGGTTLSNGSKIANKKLLDFYGFYIYYALTYEMLNDEGARLDNANIEFANKQFTGTADLNSLFSNDRYIRLQCEFKKQDEKNYDHILWHKQNAYRDLSLITDRKSHTDDLRDSLKNTEWPDGSGVNGEGEPYGTPAAAAA